MALDINELNDIEKDILKSLSKDFPNGDQGGFHHNPGVSLTNALHSYCIIDSTAGIEYVYNYFENSTDKENLDNSWDSLISKGYLRVENEITYFTQEGLEVSKIYFQ